MLLLLLLFGSIADYGQLGKKIGLAVATFSAVLFVCLVWLCDLNLFSGQTVVALASAFFIMASLSSGLASVFFSAYLSLLARNHPRVLCGQDTEAMQAARLSSLVTSVNFAGGIVGLALSVGVSAAVSPTGPLAFGNVTSNNSTDLFGNSSSVLCSVTSLTPPTTGLLEQQKAILTMAAGFLLAFSVPSFFLVHDRSFGGHEDGVLVQEREEGFDV